VRRWVFKGDPDQGTGKSNITRSCWREERGWIFNSRGGGGDAVFEDERKKVRVNIIGMAGGWMYKSTLIQRLEKTESKMGKTIWG